MSLKIESKAVLKEFVTKSGTPTNPGAQEMINAYRNHPEQLKLSDGTTTLDGIKLARQDLVQLLQRHQDGSIDNGTDLMLIFAVSHADMNANPPIPENQRSFTVILASIEDDGSRDANGNIIGRVDDGLLMNKYKPCPDDCAKFRTVFP